MKRSGQVAIILVVITMMTVLGVAVSTSTQSDIELKDTVYSAQSTKALECAQAAVERALVDSDVVGEGAISIPPKNIDDSATGANLAGCDYKATINNYPGSGAVVDLPSVL